jgi:hypothetical protein
MQATQREADMASADLQELGLVKIKAKEELDSLRYAVLKVVVSQPDMR